MVPQIQLGGIVLDIIKKNIKNVHLSVHPPAGKVRISAPLRMNTDTIRIFAISKLGWIRRQQEKIRVQDREASREYIDREIHYIWGKRYLLSVAENNEPPSVKPFGVKSCILTFGNVKSGYGPLALHPIPQCFPL